MRVSLLDSGALFVVFLFGFILNIADCRRGSVAGAPSTTPGSWSSSTMLPASSLPGSRVASLVAFRCFTVWWTGFTGAATSSVTGSCAHPAIPSAPAATLRPPPHIPFRAPPPKKKLSRSPPPLSCPAPQYPPPPPKACPVFMGTCGYLFLNNPVLSVLFETRRTDVDDVYLPNPTTHNPETSALNPQP